jgi:cysteine desulfurase
MYYFDFTATTPPNNEVLEVYNLINQKYWGNASSLYKTGSLASTLFEKAKKELKDLFKLSNHNIIFTSGATEANNIAIFGVANNYQKKHVITSKVEHPSVMACFEHLEKQGFDVTYLDVDENGIISLDQLEKAINNDTVLVSIMWVNNILGSIQPIKEITKIVKNQNRAKLHVDMVQGMAKIVPDFDFNDIDLFTVSAHKLNGLKGQGFLAYNDSINLMSVLKGSGQQNGLKPGTIDVAGACACTKAVKISYLKMQEHYEKVCELNTYLRQKINQITNVTINSGEKNYSPYILNISILGKNSETVLHFLEQFDIYVAAGSACNSKIRKPERCVLAVTNDENRALSSIRISLAAQTTIEEIDYLIDKIKLIASKE